MLSKQEIRDMVNRLVEKYGKQGAYDALCVSEDSPERREALRMLKGSDGRKGAMCENGDISDFGGGY